MVYSIKFRKQFKILNQMKINLLQRLLSPPGFESPFGGIATFLGFNDQTKRELFKIVSFDYMGATEYEFGAIPKSLQQIFLKRNNELFTEEICGAAFLIIIPKNERDQYVEKIKSWTTSNYDGHREYSGLNDIVSNNPLLKEDLVGWLDISDNVLFFRNTNDGVKMANTFFTALTQQEV